MPKSPDVALPHGLMLAGALIMGVLLALALHMLGQGLGLDLGGLWRFDADDLMPASAALAWWVVASGGFCGGFVTATLMHHTVEGQIPPKMRQFLIAIAVLVLAAAGRAASAPSTGPTGADVLSGLATLVLGAATAFCGAFFALRRR
jgi:hypothetical protein